MWWWVSTDWYHAGMVVKTVVSCSKNRTQVAAIGGGRGRSINTFITNLQHDFSSTVRIIIVSDGDNFSHFDFVTRAGRASALLFGILIAHVISPTIALDVERPNVQKQCSIE